MTLRRLIRSFVVIASTLIASSVPALAQSGPVAAYGFNEAAGTTTADASGNGHTGTIAAATWRPAGKFGSALTFNGTTSWVTINHSALLSLSGAMTLEAWVQTSTPENWRTVILKERSGGLSYALYAGDDAGRASTYIRRTGNAGDTDATSASVLPINQWVHVASTFDGTTLKTYVNGVQVASTAAAGTMQTSTNPVRIGGNSVWGEYFNGAIDEVRIYNRALTAGEIQNDMNTPVGGTAPQTYSISGAITPSSGGSGATVALTNFATASTTADVNGNYTFAGLRPGPYMVTPSRPGFTFTPLSREVVIGEGGNVTGINFTATATGATPAQVGAWSAPFDLGIVAVNMVMLRTGKVLITSGSYQTSGAERIWDPATGSITLVPNPFYNLFCSGQAQLPDGRILFAGGYDPGTMGAPNANIFDPVAQNWTAVPNMSFRRWYPSVTTLPDGKMLVTSGAQTCSTCIADVPEVYDPATNRFTRLTSARLNIFYYPFVFVLPDGRVLSAGSTEDAYETRALDLSTGLWSMVDPVVRDGHSAVMFRPGKILKMGTAADSGTVGNAQATAFVLDMTQPSPAWRQVPSMSFPRAYQNSTILPDGTVLVTGGGSTLDGHDITRGMKTAELWSPATETWQTLSSGAFSRLYHSTSLLLPDGRILVAGSGDDVGAVNETRGELFSPPYLFKGARPVITGAPDLIQYGGTFNVVTPDAGSIASVALIRPAAVTHAFDEDQRYVPLSFSIAPGGLVVQAPANANLAPPGYYMLFIVNSNGVPSIAPFVRFAVASGGADTTAPSAPGSLVGQGGLGTVSLTWSASTDNVAVAGYDVHRSLVPGFVPTAANRVAQVSTTSYSAPEAPGSYFYVVTAQDSAGNVSAPSNEAAVVVVGDTTAPSVAIVAPLAGSTVSGPVTVTASAVDNLGVAGVSFLIDGAPLGSEDLTAPYAMAWDSNGATNGQHTIKAIARDAAGNTAESSIVVTVSNAVPDTTAPQVAITAPAAQSTATGSITLSATATDAVGVVGVQFQVDGVAIGAELTVAPYATAWDTTAVANGAHTITAIARDAAGNRSQASVAITVSNDKTGPSIAFAAPAAGSTATGTIALTATASDNVAVASVQFYVDGVKFGTAIAAAPYTTSWDTTKVSNGPHTLSAIATDAAGNTGQATVAVTVFNDTTAPAITITSPTALSTVSGSLTISATASDNVVVTGVQFRLDGALLGAELTSAPYTAAWDTKTATNGPHTITATARDAAGNTTTASVTVTVFNDAVAPTVSFVTPLNGSTVGGTIPVTASALDNVAVTSVQLRLDGAPLGAAMTSAPYTVSLDTTKISNGPHTLTATAADAAGNTAQATVTVSVFNDATAPVITITAPAAGSTVSGSVAVSASATDNVAVAGVQFRIDGAPLGGEISSAPYAATWDSKLASNGSHTITAIARDAAGNTTTASVTVTVFNDTTAPTISFATPANGATVSGTIPVTASAADNVGIASVQLRLDGNNLGAALVSAPYTVSLDTTQLSNGPHTLTAIATDAAGNAAQAIVTVSVFNDAAAPVVSIASPAAGSTVGGSVSVVASATDDVAVIGLQFQVDGAPLGSEMTSAPYTVSWNSKLASNGTHTITATARDAAGNSTTASVTVTVFNDTAAPTVNFVTPANGATVGGTIAVTASASDNVGVTSVRLMLDGAPLGADMTAAPYTASWDTTKVSNGAHTLVAIATDAEGNSAQSMVTVSVFNDMTAPVVSITSPAAGSTVSGAVTIAASATDDVEVIGVQFRLDGAPLGSEITSAPYTTSWDTRLASNGTHTITAIARDAAGNSTTASVTVTVFNDTTAPAVSFATPANGATVSGTIPVTALASDNVGVTSVQLRLDGNNLGAAIAGAPYTDSLDTTQLSNGPHTLVAIATDAAGNTAQAAVTVSVLNDAAAPVVSITAPAAGSTVSGSVTVLASASDDVAVTGVQFRLDGAPLGAEITSAPYRTTFDSKLASNGSHTITAIARDAAGNSTTASVTVTVFNDTTAPTVSFVTPANGATVGGTIAVTAAATDDVGVTSVQLRLDGNNLGAALVSAPYMVTLDTTTLSNGPHTLTATAIDAAGNAAQATVTVTVFNDAAAPVVSITSPAAGSTVSGTVTIAATASDDVAVTGVQFRIDGAPFGSEITSAPYAAAWDTTLASNGSHTITAVARDAAGNSTTRPVTVTVFNDTTEPTVTFVTPANGATVGGTIAVTAAATDNVGVSSVQLRLDGNDLGAALTTAPYTASLDTTTLSNGPHTLTAIAADAKGNTAQATVTVTVFNDATAPVVSITSPAAGSTVSDAVTIAATATDNVAVTGVQFRIDGVALGAEITSAPYTTSWDSKLASNGAHTISAIARDAAGNSTTRSVTVTVFNDTTAPTVSFLAPGNGATVGGTIAVTAAATDNVGVTSVQLRLDGNNLGAALTAAPYTASLDTTTLSNGSHTLAAIATDAEGNTAQSTVTVTVFNDETGPVVSITSPAAGSTVSGTVTIAASASDVVAVAGVQFRIDGAPFGPEITSAPYAITWETELASNGPYTITAVARDTAGNSTTTSVTVTVFNDTTPPTVSILAPMAQSTVSGSIAVTASANDNVGVASVQFLLDGAPLGSSDGSAPYSVTWNTTTAADGPHTITAVARDAAGNLSQAAPVTVIVDNVVQPPPPPSGAGLVLAYSFEGNANTAIDDSGNGNDGSIRRGALVAGRSGSALSFDGNTWVTAADSASLDLSTGMTLEAWVRPTVNNNNRAIIVKERTTGGFAYSLFSSDETERPFTGIRGTTERRAVGPSTVPINVWTHLAATYDGAVLRLYINGVQVSSITGAGPMINTLGALRLGFNSADSSTYRGLMDDVRVYNRALTAQEIAADMNTPVK